MDFISKLRGQIMGLARCTNWRQMPHGSRTMVILSPSLLVFTSPSGVAGFEQLCADGGDIRHMKRDERRRCEFRVIRHGNFGVMIKFQHHLAAGIGEEVACWGGPNLRATVMPRFWQNQAAAAVGLG